MDGVVFLRVVGFFRGGFLGGTKGTFFVSRQSELWYPTTIPILLNPHLHTRK
jgi:hypothetical protein